MSFPEDLLDVQKSQFFDEYFGYIMDKLISFEKYAVLNRKSNSADCYAYRLFHSLASNKFKLICLIMFPTKPMQKIKAAWPILGRVLENILRRWLIGTVCIK